MKLWAALIVSILMVAPVAAADQQTYRNVNWRYSVTLPATIRYSTSKPPNPNHGFRIDISKDASIWVDAGSSDDETLPQAVSTELHLWKSQRCVETAHKATTLGGRPASRILLRCQNIQGFRRVAIVIALEAPAGMNNTAYTVGVTYPEVGEERRPSIAAFDAVLRGFRLFAK